MKIETIFHPDFIEQLRSSLNNIFISRSNVDKRSLVKEVGLFDDAIASGILPQEMSKWRSLSDEELSAFKSGKKLPENFPFPDDDSLGALYQETINSDDKRIEFSYRWYLKCISKWQILADCLSAPILLGLLPEYTSRQGVGGGIIPATNSSKGKEKEEEAKMKDKKKTNVWSSEKVRPDFIERLVAALEETFPPGSKHFMAAEPFARKYGFSKEEQVEIGRALRMDREDGTKLIPGFGSQRGPGKGISRSENIPESKNKPKVSVKAKGEAAAMNIAVKSALASDNFQAGFDDDTPSVPNKIEDENIQAEEIDLVSGDLNDEFDVTEEDAEEEN